MNPFFVEEQYTEKRAEFAVPGRVYARLIDGDGGYYQLFDAIEANWFDNWAEQQRGQVTPERWFADIDDAPVYAVEVNSRGRTEPVAGEWLHDRPRPLPRWAEMELSPNPKGPAEVYANIAGLPQRADLKLSALSSARRRALKAATDLGPYVVPDATITALIPNSQVERVVVIDVGQGGAAALLGTNDEIVAYVDMGAGVLADTSTRPAPMTVPCLRGEPIVFLSHWHYDHFELANIVPPPRTDPKTLIWIAPLQVLGPGPQSAFAGALVANRKLRVWGGSGSLSAGSIELERCTGPGKNLNRSGLAVWVRGPSGQAPILLPGDAGYGDIPGLAGGRGITAFAVSHHGGRAAGSPPPRPHGPTVRAAFSYGHGNSYHHPLAGSIAGLTAARWHLGPFPGTAVDERRTEDRSHGTGGGGFGHIGLAWSGSAIFPHACTCGCSIDPTQ